MPSREWILRIQDILTAASENVERTQKMSFEDFESVDSLLMKGILYNFIIIGEAGCISYL